ncbi:hypothetical protein Pfo_021818 [Paulownia fortunei]|nr:hypothetical protein Pfo_021818 [Paulownia fortunei]
MANSPSTIVSISTIHNMPTDVYPEKLHTSKQRELASPTDSIAPSCYQKIIAEVLGTYIFVFAGCGAALFDREKTLSIVGMAMVPALALMAMIYAVGHVSGAHFNPAVTIAFAVAHKLPLKHVPMYVLSQLFGSTLACLTLRALVREQSDILPMLTQYSSSSTTDLEAISWEFIMTFILMFTISGVASDDRAVCFPPSLKSES